MTPGTEPISATNALPVTLFRDRSGSRLETLSFDDFQRLITSPQEFPKKDACPLVKLARFGSNRTQRDSLRHDGNVIAVTGVEADYDGGLMGLLEAVLLLDLAHIQCQLYTSPSHTAEHPRWRVLAPLSKEHPPHERAKFVARLNGVLGGVLAAESFVLSQSFYFGRVAGSPYETHSIAGDFIDVREDLDASANWGLGRGSAGAGRDHQSAPDFSRDLSIRSAGAGTIGDLQSALAALPDEWPCDYALWVKIGMALASLKTSAVGVEALDLWHAFSGRSAKYDPAECQKKWDGFSPQKATFASIFFYARREAGWVNPRSLATEGEARSVPRDELRREQQKREAQRIGEHTGSVPIAEQVTLQQALDRFVFLSDGSRVADRLAPHYDLALCDFKNTFSASRENVPQPPRHNADGSVVQRPDKRIPVVDLWSESPNRLTAISRTFKAGGPEVVDDPSGRRCLNLWRAFDRSRAGDADGEAVQLFLAQVNYLFDEDAPRFLDWLAHIEQQPGVLPHTSWLHISAQHGLGRNWLASCLARVWAGSVASNFDLVGTLRSSFNERLSKKVLAVVDEIREGGRDSAWDHSEQLKSLLTQEVRTINPKFGRQHLEFNACRWLILSNHMAALPIDQSDRRIDVVCIEKPPRDPEAYVALYNAIDDPGFVASVAAFLARRDIAKFNPGARALLTSAKSEVLSSSLSPAAKWVQMLVESWPSDLIKSSDLADILNGDDYPKGSNLTAAQRRTLEQFGVQALGVPRKINGQLLRLAAVRNKSKWKTAPTEEIVEHYLAGAAAVEALKRQHNIFSARNIIDALMAEA